MSSDEPSNFVGIVSWFLLICSGFAVFSRLSARFAVFRKLGMDDGFSVASLLFNIGAGIAVTFQCANGLGTDTKDLPQAKAEKFEKATFALEILYISTLCFAKLSIMFLLRRLSPDDYHQKAGTAIGCLVALWGSIAILVIGFHCEVPATWKSINGKCINIGAFWHTAGVFNIITDLLLILYPIYIIQSLQMSLKRKIKVLLCFGTRGLDVVATCFQLAYTTRSFSSSNLTSNIWPWVLIAQLIQTITITTSCIPYLRPLLKEYPSGMFLVEETRRGGETTLPTQKPNQIYILRDTQQSVQAIEESRFKRKKQKDFDYLAPSSSGIGPTFETAVQPSELENGNENILWDSSSQRSHSRIIKAVTTIQTSWSDAVK